jgi:uncharacterized membrane protein YdbT with pleckstrin-like domain
MLHLDPEETIVIEVRKHWFVFFAHGFFLAIAAIVPALLYWAVEKFTGFRLPIEGNYYMLVLFFYTLWLLFLWISFFIQWTNYYLDVWHITQKRIIDVEQKSLFHREVSSIRFDKVQDITIEVRGLLATFLDIGDVRVQTASENSKDFFMASASAPERIRKVVFAQHNKAVEKTQPVRIVDRNGDRTPDYP